MMARKLLMASALLLGMTSVTFAQRVYITGPYGYAPDYGYIVTAPQYGYGLYDYYGASDYGCREFKGGPGPRFGCGFGAGSDSQR